LIRLEYQAEGRFEDRASYFAVLRDQAPQPFQKTVQGQRVQIETARFSLDYRADGKPFYAGNLSIQVKAAGAFKGAAWKPGAPNAGNLGGTLRTLDEAEGPVPLDPGVLSRDGWFFKDDSETVLFGESDGWAQPRADGAGSDAYFFAYGLDYASALADFVSVSGPVPLPPRYSFGTWYSRYWPYTSDEFLAIADEFRQRGFPLDVMVLDMDWHQDGWTGYSWNKGLIPDPVGLLKALHQRGLATTMNLHPHDGVAKHEDAYPAFAKGMGMDPAKGERVPFDVTDPLFMKNYFQELLRPLEQQGVDFWWMDWQQGTSTKIKGLDPLMWLNHLHFWDRQKARPGHLRGMNFSRWGGWGDHRYPVQFSGDTHANWESLGFQAQFTASAGNVGVSYWSHDLGGHFGSGDRVEPELYLRWLQFGALSPVMRIHSSRDPRNDRRPWLFGQTFEAAARAAFALRASLVPYLYTAARQAFDSGLPLLRPLYLHYPEQEEAYRCPMQYLLGGDLLVVLVADPGFGPRQAVQAPVWIPEGDWYHWETHERFSGPQWTTVTVPLEGVAVFARGGAAIPLNGPGHAQACASHGPLRLRLYPGPSSQRELYEDDGQTLAYADKGGRRTVLTTVTQVTGQRVQAGVPSDGSARAELLVEAPRHRLSQGLDSLGPQHQSLPGGTAPAHLDLALLAPADRAVPYDAALGLQRRALLALEQLPQAHALRDELHKLAAQAEHQLNQVQGQDPLPRVEATAAELTERERGLIQRLAKDASAEAALRVLAGVSLLAFVDRSPSGIPQLKLELRRDARAIRESRGGLQVQWRVDGGASGTGESELGGRVSSLWEGAWPVDGEALRRWQGAVTVLFEAFGCRFALTEALDWDGRTLKDWAILGPVDLKAAVNGPALAGLMVTGAVPAWKVQRFDPTRVAKGLRHFHDLGKHFHCPGEAVWALSEVQASEAGNAQLTLLHEGELKAWLNGEALRFDPDHRAQVRLHKGANTVLVRLEDVKSQGRGLYVRFDPAAGAAPALRATPAAALQQALQAPRS
jgi:alpha-glucosidase (family GH31 glycosyl hydrolase)